MTTTQEKAMWIRFAVVFAAMFAVTVYNLIGA